MKKWVAVGLIFLAACASGPRTKEYVIYHGNLKSVEVTGLRSLRKDGVLTVQATLLNTGRNEKLSYRFRWYTQGQLSAIHESWKPLPLRKGQSDDFIGIAPSPDVTDFKLELISYEDK